VSAESSPGSWLVDREGAGQRLDRALAVRLSLPRSRVQRWIERGRVRVDGSAPAKSGATLRAGSLVTWDPPPRDDGRLEPEAGELVLLHEDADFLALDKPAELVVHPGAGRPRGTLAHRLLARFPELAGVGGPGRPGIVHRLDRGTTGVLLVARTPESYDVLSRGFAARAIEKSYLGIVWGSPAEKGGLLDQPIGRHPVDRKRMAVRPRGRVARTGWRLLRSAGPIALVQFELFTGRTHQIRVHASAWGHPLVGDPVYGGRAAASRGTAAARASAVALGRPALHAWRLALAHPRSREPLRLESPVPDDFRRAWEEIAGAPFPVLPKATAGARAAGRRT
jgi:23S rRNA pseudouridine1911/1915/1917 synthase